jgi:hypothetical protein
MPFRYFHASRTVEIGRVLNDAPGVLLCCTTTLGAVGKLQTFHKRNFPPRLILYIPSYI